MGAPGTGKTLLFPRIGRAVAMGRRGGSCRPREESMMFLPRGTPYLPRGTLKEVLAYPLLGRALRVGSVYLAGPRSPGP